MTETISVDTYIICKRETLCLPHILLYSNRCLYLLTVDTVHAYCIDLDEISARLRLKSTLEEMVRTIYSDTSDQI